MDILNSLANETATGTSEEINAVFNGMLKRIENQETPSLEANVFADTFTRIFDNMVSNTSLARLGQHQNRSFQKINQNKNWLDVKEIVVDIPVTFKATNFSTIVGHILKSKDVIANSNHMLKRYTTVVGGYISNPDALSPISGIPSSFIDKEVTIHGIPALRTMLDVNTSSRTKLERIFMSVSDINAAATLLTELNTVVYNVDLMVMNDRADRLAELLKTLKKDVGAKASKNSITTMTKDISKLASLVSDVGYVSTVADVLSRVMKQIHKSIETETP